MRKEVPPEIWFAILAFVQKPLPPALSNPFRSELQNPALCSAARVCKLFKNITNTLLYTDVIIVDLPRLVADIHTPSKRRLLALIRSLKIEYTPKGQHPTYISLLSSRNRWVRYGMASEEEQAEAKMADCEQEVTDLLRCLQTLGAMGMFQVFPRLETIAIASLCDRPVELWLTLSVVTDEARPDLGHDLKRCFTAFERFLGSGSLLHLCIRDPCGPLSLNMKSHPPARALTYTRTIHFDSTDLAIPLSVIGPLRWISDVKSTEYWTDTIQHLAMTINGFYRYHGTEGTPPQLDLDIFCSTSKYGVLAPELRQHDFAGDILGEPLMPYDGLGPTLSAATQQSMAVELGERAQTSYRAVHNPLDRIRWNSSALTPTCHCCGSGCPE